MQNEKPDYKTFRKIIKPKNDAIKYEKLWIAQYIRENLSNETAEKLSITILRNWYKKIFNNH